MDVNTRFEVVHAYEHYLLSPNSSQISHVAVSRTGGFPSIVTVEIVTPDVTQISLVFVELV